MKKTIALLSFLIAATFSAFAQNAELDNAFTLFNIKQVDKAKESIDKATANDKTKDLPKTWAYRSLIYSSMAVDSNRKAKQDQNLQVAKEAIAKTKQLDKKNEYKQDIDNSSRNLAQVYANKGISQYNAKDYKGATESFKFVSSVLPTDTTWMQNTAAAALNAQDYDQAILSYSSLMKIKPNEHLYELLSQAELGKKDSSAYLKTLQEGRIKYPENNNLINNELNYYLSKGQASLVLDKLKNAIDKDPKNTNLYVVLGSTYEKMKRVDSAETAYKKAVVLDPKNFAANFNLGAIYYNRAATILAKANKLPRNKIKEYNAEVVKFKKTFEQATPYLESAHSINPRDIPTMVSLKEIYVRTNQNAKAALMQKLIQAADSK